MPATIITPEIKKDLLILKSRGVLDPKRHYKKDKNILNSSSKDGLPKYFQFGTIIGGNHGGATKANRDTIVNQLLQDTNKNEYFKKKFTEIQQKNVQNAPNWLKKKILAKKLKMKKMKK